MEAKARAYYDAAIKWKAKAEKEEQSSKYYLNEATRYYGHMQNRDEIIHDLKKQIRDLKNSEKRLDAHFWKVGFFVCLAVLLPATLILGVV